MTQVDFYILGNNATSDRFQLTCRLTEKAYQEGHRVMIATESDRDAKVINDMLWTYREQSFIPHDLDTDSSKHAPVLIASNLQHTDEHDVLINLGTEIPACFGQFERLLEPVDKDEQHKIAGRKRYRYYRDCGYSINNHEINR